jgi:preprotein translocase subunit SecA
MEWAGMDENTPIENKLVNRAIESAQVKVEGYHFDIRKHLVEYDDVVNKHRELIYAERRKLLGGADLKSNILSMVREEIHNAVDTYINNKPDEEKDYRGLLNEVKSIMPLPTHLNVSELSLIEQDAIDNTLLTKREHKDKKLSNGKSS